MDLEKTMNKQRRPDFMMSASERRAKSNKADLLAKYQISDAEFNELESVYTSYARHLSSDMPSISEFQQIEKEYNEIVRAHGEKQQAEYEHGKKGILGRTFSEPKYVRTPNTYNVERAIDAIDTAKEEENRFSYLCDAHGLDHTTVFQDLITVVTIGYPPEKTADSFRAYLHAKNMSMFYGNPRAYL